MNNPFPIDLQAIEAYAVLTQDFNPLHVDPVFAARTPMGGVIAHGTMSLVPALMAAVDHHWHGDDDGGVQLELDVRFISPARPGDAVAITLQPRSDGQLDLSVRGSDAGERIAGTLRLRPSPPR